jgi:hypothetical protein
MGHVGKMYRASPLLGPVESFTCKVMPYRGTCKSIAFIAYLKYIPELRQERA